MSPNKVTWRGLTVWLICAAFFMYEFLLRTVLGTFQYPIMDDLHLSPMKFAFLSSTAYQVIYGVMQLPVGIITDRFGLKKTLFSAVLICGLANVGFALTHQFDVAFLFRVLMGLGSAFGFVCLLVAVYDWMPRKNIALFIGLSQFIGTLGPMLAAGPLNAMAEEHLVGWRGFFLALALAAVVLGALILGFVENKRETTGKFLILNRDAAIKENLLRIIKQPEIWFIAFFSATIYFAIEYLSENEGTAFLMEKGFTSTFSSYMITFAWLGYALGCPMLGYLSDWIEKRKPVMIGSALAILLGLTGIIYFDLNRAATTICFLLVGIGASGQSIGFAIIAEYCKERYLAVGLAFNNAMIMFCSAINAPLVGYLLSRLSSPGAGHSLATYREAFLILIALALCAVFLSMLMIKETYCKSMRENTVLNPA
ncbi:MFS transporter [Legionella impletisoli]|uniref:Lysosomal dipeptide transporter MFSD1 n=1 Tax=Legionella impletisoli TaxID=343510 RepID=A0A917NDX3_9GAMM|nr:MFS transporter [Legionella impletisoli]GGI92654.1 MFS transporter [Legionella impletisoli]